MTPELRAFLELQRRHALGLARELSRMLGLRDKTRCPTCGADLT